MQLSISLLLTGRGYSDSYLYCEPYYLPVLMFVSYGMANVCSICGMVIIEHVEDYAVVGYTVALALEALFCIIATCFAIRALKVNEDELKDLGKEVEVWCTIGLVHKRAGATHHVDLSGRPSYSPLCAQLLRSV